MVSLERLFESFSQNVTAYASYAIELPQTLTTIT